MLTRGNIDFDTETSKVWGELVVNLASGEAAATLGVRKCPGEILDSGKFLTPHLFLHP